VMSGPADRSPDFLSAPVKILPVAWPAMFEPQHLICGAGPQKQEMVTALTARGLGYVIPFSNGAPSEPRSIFLSGVGELGPVAGAAWTSQGLELVTKSGKLLVCKESSPDTASVLSCTGVPQAALLLPRSSSLASAALTELAGGWRLAAVQLEETQGAVMLFKRSQAEWRPAGEIHVVSPKAQLAQASRMGLSFSGEELLVTLPTGEVQRRHLSQGSSVVFESSAAKKEWRSACTLPSGATMRLAMQHSETEGGSAWLPELIAPN